MNNVIIIRGPSGSGKSTYASFLLESGAAHYHFETDKYFMFDGEYKFDASKLSANHARCFNEFTQAIKNNDGNIVVSNTSIKCWEYDRYKQYAEKYNFRVFVIIMGQQFENTHGVPEEKVAQMRRNFEY